MYVCEACAHATTHDSLTFPSLLDPLICLLDALEELTFWSLRERLVLASVVFDVGHVPASGEFCQ